MFLLPSFKATRFSFPKSSNLTPPCIFKALIVATRTLQSTCNPPTLALISRNFSAPKSAANPASVITIGDNFNASFVAIKDEQPCAILANGPPWIKHGLFSLV